MVDSMVNVLLLIETEISVFFPSVFDLIYEIPYINCLDYYQSSVQHIPNRMRVCVFVCSMA